MNSILRRFLQKIVLLASVHFFAPLRKVLSKPLYYILSDFYVYGIKEVKPDGSLEKITDFHCPGKISILALSSHKFRGDLEVLAKEPDLRMLRISNKWQNRLVHAFCPFESMNYKYENFHNPQKDSWVDLSRQRLRRFLCGFLPLFYKKIQVDCVITPNSRYEVDLDWGWVSKDLGRPFVVIFRESLATVAPHDHYYKEVTSRNKRQGPFRGTHIIVHNRIGYEMFVKSGYISKKQLSVVGCLRMDEFFVRIHKNEIIPHKRQKVVLFPFSHRMPLFGPDHGDNNDKVFKDTHLAFIKLAIENAKINFVIKPKPSWAVSSWRNYLDKALAEENIQVDEIDNLSIDANLNVHDLILGSDVICGLQSTTLLEAAIAGKPVVLSCYKEFRSTQTFSSEYALRNHLNLFDVADDADHFKNLIMSRLQNPYIEKTVQDGRWEMFKHFVTQEIDGNSGSRYVALLKRLITEKGEK